jgi:hypothetical protein
MLMNMQQSMPASVVGSSKREPLIKLLHDVRQGHSVLAYCWIEVHFLLSTLVCFLARRDIEVPTVLSTIVCLHALGNNNAKFYMHLPMQGAIYSFLKFDKDVQ